ncbi:MAG: HAD-IIIC family phosphatase [Methylomonas sp.]|jgi:FkbH-like protein
MSVTEMPAQNGDFPIVIVSSFTAEPIENVLLFWMRELEVQCELKFAPYNQIFQQLLDPMSMLRQNQGGMNVLLLRFEDWLRAEKEFNRDKLSRLYDELRAALYSAAENLNSPLLVCACQDSPRSGANPEQNTLFAELRNRLEHDLRAVSNCYLITPAELDRYPAADYYDALSDELGHIPYTPKYYAAVATSVARKISAIKSAPHKVIVLDCDNTLWGGVIGEDGLTGIDVSADWQFLQGFMLAQKEAGMLLCLCSKNTEADALEVFEKHPDMRLRLSDMVAWRINWSSKSENILSLAEELNLGLDSFIFLDDNPIECEEVRANCPGVLSLNLPRQNIPLFLKHIWAFDRIKVTSEDKLRTALYQQDIARKNLQKSFGDYQDFLNGLELTVNIGAPGPEQLPRVAQLTQRTNQFNNTTIRRSEIDVQRLPESNLQLRIVEVKDRYGDYGLVGVIIFEAAMDALTVQSFMLSCRVLGRGVENHILKYLAAAAKEKGLSVIRIPYAATPKNQPILKFLEQILPAGGRREGEMLLFDIPADKAAAMNTVVRSDLSVAEPKKTAGQAANNKQSAIPLSVRLAETTAALASAEQILACAESRKTMHSRELSEPVTPPGTDTEKTLVEIWRRLLTIDEVGVDDDYFDMGGTSLLTVQLIIEVENAFAVRLPLSAILEYPTVKTLAGFIRPETGQNSSGRPVLLNNGGGRAAIYFIHDGDGEILLYRNLALHLEHDFRVYGLTPFGNSQCPMLDTSIPVMAAHYIAQIQAQQPQGPYLLAGMCAGGVIAFEVAKQLRAAGQTVGFIGLIDAADVAAIKRAGRVANQRLNRFSAALGGDENVSLASRALNIAKIIGGKIFNLVSYELSSRINKLADNFKINLLNQCRMRNRPLPGFLTGLSVRSVYLYAESKYRPGAAIDETLVLFRATAGVKEDEPYIEVYADPLFGWGERTARGVKIYDIPGGHSSMLQEPNVKFMAECIREYTGI